MMNMSAWKPIDLFTDTAAILISIVSNGYYGMPRGQINVPEHPIMSFETIEIKMAARISKKVYSLLFSSIFLGLVFCW